MVLVTFSVNCFTEWGESVGILGSHPALGAWNKSSVVLLNTGKDSFPLWSVDIDVDDKAQIEYKYVILNQGKIVKWEFQGKDSNRRFTIDSAIQKLDADWFNDVKDFKTGTPKPKNQQSKHNVDLSSLNPKNVEGLNEFENWLIAANDQKRSWRKRLEFIRELFCNKDLATVAHFDATSVENLASIVIYLTFLKSGQIPCQEDGSHYRPNHHANEAKLLEEELSRVTNEKTAFLIRKIFPLLPSYRSEFTQSVPLTRIRDIAHRSDIPHDLKQDIKHNLQNKLHRCAGPEDLITCERILNQVTAPGANYSGGFVEQMRIFHKELLEFFNATSLDDLLYELRDEKEPFPSTEPQLSDFLFKKQNKVAAIEQVQSLTKLRQALSSSMDQIHGEVLQRVRLADIGLDDFSFVLLAGINNIIESNSEDWDFLLESCKLAAQNIELSGIGAKETKALAAEFSNLQAIGNVLDGDSKYRLKACFDRAVRFCEDFGNDVSGLYLGRVQVLGPALGVDSNSIKVFAEAEIRSNVVFQLSNMVVTASRYIRNALNLPNWDPLFPGTAVGRVIIANSINDISEDDLQMPIIAVVSSAEGDEEIPTNIQGIVLGHTLPHLSHLGVRSRQAKVVFVSSEEAASFRDFQNNARGLEKKYCALKVTVDGNITLDITTEAETKATDVELDKIITIPEADTSGRTLISLSSVEKTNAGSKSWAAGQLDGMASQKALFKSPDGAAITFGVFKTALDNLGETYLNAIEAFSSLSLKEKERKADEIREKLSALMVEQGIVDSIQKQFGSKTLMVRSSANCEDLENMSGAGLYDSISNVPANDSESIVKAIINVWQSLWTRRAALSRDQAHVPHEKAFMGILIQEMIQSEMCFIMFSQNPINGKEDEVYMEIALGMGEILASGAVRGVPYRATFNRKSKEVKFISFASFSHALVPSSLEEKAGAGKLEEKTVDYSEVRLTTDANYRRDIVTRLGEIALCLEQLFGSAQDIEGAIIGAEVYVVQSRPMVK